MHVTAVMRTASASNASNASISPLILMPPNTAQTPRGSWTPMGDALVCCWGARCDCSDEKV
jgi:hypothetical protein